MERRRTWTSTLRAVLRLALAAFMLIAGIGHLVSTDSFLGQVPTWLPQRTLIVVVSGFVEIGFALALVLLPRRRRQVGWALAAFFVVVFPGNLYQAIAGTDAFGLDTQTARWARLAFQPVLVVWALWASGAWPRARDATPRREPTPAPPARYPFHPMDVDIDFEPLVTERLLLRRSRPEDAETISEYRSDPDVHVHQGWDRTDVEGVRAEIEEMTRRAPGEPGGWVQLSVEERASGHLVGDVGLSRAEGEPGVIKVGYTIAPEHQRRGYATEAIRALVGYAFDTLDAEVVRAYASAENTPSIRVAEKVGMHLVERIEHRDGDEVWIGVRYELRREDRAPAP